jgi:hypothetical protein
MLGDPLIAKFQGGLDQVRDPGTWITLAEVADPDAECYFKLQLLTNDKDLPRELKFTATRNGVQYVIEWSDSIADQIKINSVEYTVTEAEQMVADTNLAYRLEGDELEWRVVTDHNCDITVAYDPTQDKKNTQALIQIDTNTGALLDSEGVCGPCVIEEP